VSNGQTPAVRLERASLRLGGRPIWTDVSLTVAAGEFLAVMGPNGVGKTSLLRAVLGLQPLAAGTVHVGGRAPRPGNAAIGYVPQQRAFDPDLPIRGRDLVGFGLNGHRWGVTLRPDAARQRIDRILTLVDAAAYADAPIGRLSGGEQQRLRIAQALVSDPTLLLCDEPLLSLDLHYQQVIVQLIADWNRSRGATVIFVTHDINPLLSVVDRILLLTGARWAAGSPDEILTSEALSRVYGLPVEVLRHRGRVLVVGAELGGHEPVLTAHRDVSG
jgi:zinc/manganese transport system ATP-binding protein